ncbi:MAG: CdaR family protein [Chloroflexota bacterium]|nr:CdaR family protein [Chloroflexota bacterium]
MGFLLRNWHLKLSAVLLATVLYTGLVFSGSLAEASVQVPIQPINQPDGSVVLSGAPGTVDFTYRAASDIPQSLLNDSFRATVDLSGYDMERAPEPQVLSVEVVSLVDGVEVTTQEPENVTVEIDRFEEKSVPVEVDYGEVPEELEIGEPTLSVDTARVLGAATLVARVDRAVARVIIDESGIDVVRPSVTLEPVDVDGQPVAGVEVDPEAVGVQIDVETVETEKTVPVRPDIEPGTPAPGFALESLLVEPAVVTLVGLPEDLQPIRVVTTEPLSITGLSATETFETQLVLPDGVELAPADSEAVSVTATIEPSVSSRSFVVGVVCQGAGTNACLPALEQVTVTLSGLGDALEGIGAGDLTPTLDASGLAPGAYDLTPTLPALPDGVDLIGISPSTVQVTIVAPAPPPTPTPAP